MATEQDPTATPAVRASDADRERTAAHLREHYAAGRLAPDELSERLDGTFAARTMAELDALAGDLPALDDPPGVRTGRAAAGSPTREQARARVLHAAGFFVLVNAACVAIWLASGADGLFWPRWVLLATAIRLAFRTWSELGPGAAHDEARLGRGGSGPRLPGPPPEPPLPPRP